MTSYGPVLRLCGTTKATCRLAVVFALPIGRTGPAGQKILIRRWLGDASRHFRNKKKAYLKVKIEELETNSKNNNVRDLYRGINDSRRGTSLELL